MSKLEIDFDFERDIKVLNNFDLKGDPPFEKIIKKCQNHLSNLRKIIFLQGFNSVQSEIHFFKKIKQEPLQALIYSSELKSFEARFPKGNISKQQKYILNSMKEVNKFFQINYEFCQYIKNGLLHLDKFYYTRKHFLEFTCIFSAPFFRDPDFCTSHDFLLAKSNAHEKFIVYLENRLRNLKNSSFKKLNSSDLKWTSSKVALTELTYALYHGGAVNNGNSDIIEIANALEQTFNFPLGDVYRTYTEIRLRKNSRSKFLDELSKSLILGMNSSDK